MTDARAPGWFALSCLFLLSGSAFAHPQAPSVLVDKGACPFECCTYGLWTAVADTQVFQAPDATAPMASVLRSGTRASALTGMVRTVGKKFVVDRPHLQYKPGDVLTVYTYLGEGVFKVWANGGFHEEDLGFSPYGGSTGTRCNDAQPCWGRLEAELDSRWWVQLQLPDGSTGWILDAQNFDGADACG